MPEFFSHLVNVSKASVNKLKSGAEGMIKKVGSGVSIHLSESNHAKCMKAYKKNKGCRLKLTAEEINQNDDEVSGSGFFKTLNKMGISRRQFTQGGKKIARAVAPIAKEVIPVIFEQAGNALGTVATKSPVGGVIFGALGKQVGKQVGVQASNELTKLGKGFRPVGAGFRPAGQSMIGSGIATLRPDYVDGYSNILPINHPIYSPAIIKVGFGM
jgi:hypothetical protein